MTDAPTVGSTLHRKIEQLHFWLDALTPTVIRSVETALPVTMPDGTRLRGLELAPGIYLTRDRRVYELRGQELVELFVQEVALLPQLPTVLARLEAAAGRGVERAGRRKTARRSVVRRS